MVYYCLLSAALYIITVHPLVYGLYVKAEFVHVYSPEIGSSTLLKCEWNTNESPSTLEFSSFALGQIYVCDLTNPKDGPKRYRCSDRPGAASGRYDYVSFGVGQISLTIDQLQCTDSGVYKCSLSKEPDVANSETSLNIRVRPTAPTMSDVSVSSGDANANLTATCEANVRPDEILWRIYNRNGGFLPSPLIFTQSCENLNEAGNSCEERTRSVAKVAGRQDMGDLVLACFITNTTTQPHAPRVCNVPAGHLCAAVRAVDVVYQGTSSKPPEISNNNEDLSTAPPSKVTDPPTNPPSSVKDPPINPPSSVKDPSIDPHSSVKDPPINPPSSVKDPPIIPSPTTTVTSTMKTLTETSATSPQPGTADADTDKNAPLVIIGLILSAIIAIIVIVILIKRKKTS